MTENVLKGMYNGGTIPIGFKVDEEKFFQVDPLKAPFVVEAFQRYNDGATMKELMNWLNDSGVTTNRQPEVYLQQCSDAADEQTVHRRKPLQGHCDARQHPGHRGQGLV